MKTKVYYNTGQYFDCHKSLMKKYIHLHQTSFETASFLRAKVFFVANLRTRSRVKNPL